MKSVYFALLAGVTSLFTVSCDAPRVEPDGGGLLDAPRDGSAPPTDGAIGPDAPLPLAQPESTLHDRDELPVVITGAALGPVLGLPVGEVVFFRWHDDGWEPIPFQVDERRVQAFSALYGSCTMCVGDDTTVGLFYADPNTLTGADANPRIDLDDEIAIMARDAGGAPSTLIPPPGVGPGFVARFALRDPLEPTAVGFVFAFRDAGSAARSDRDYVDYHFVLSGGSYPDDFNFRGIGDSGAMPANPEDTSVVAGSYTRHFRSRWLSDEVRILTHGTPGPDLIDLHDVQFAPGTCGRSMATFSSGEGAFVANIDGPVRAIRDHLGANSGPLTEAVYRFYERTEHIELRLRVHEIPAVMEFIDHSSAAIGMTYSDTNNRALPIDGVPDVFVLGAIDYQVVSGTPGSMTHAVDLETNIPGLTRDSYYLDEAPASVPQCVGDDDAIAAGATFITGGIPATDPRPVRGASRRTFVAHRFSHYSSDPTTPEDAAAFAGRYRAPLEIVASVIAAPSPSCGDGICQSGETTATCTTDCAGSTIACGDGVCEAPEDDYACPADCDAASPMCGDGVCNGSEDHASCNADCEMLVCGDGACRGETVVSCPEDCTDPVGTCGDFACEPPAETAATCAFDCAARCGDRACNGGETGTTCPADCAGSASECGDATCSSDENAEACPADCAEACLTESCPDEASSCIGVGGCSAAIRCIIGCAATEPCVTGCLMGRSVAVRDAANAVLVCGRAGGCLP